MKIKTEDALKSAERVLSLYGFTKSGNLYSNSSNKCISIKFSKVRSGVLVDVGLEDFNMIGYLQNVQTELEVELFLKYIMLEIQLHCIETDSANERASNSIEGINQ